MNLKRLSSAGKMQAFSKNSFKENFHNFNKALENVFSTTNMPQTHAQPMQTGKVHASTLITSNNSNKFSSNTSSTVTPSSATPSTSFQRFQPASTTQSPVPNGKYTSRICCSKSDLKPRPL